MKGKTLHITIPGEPIPKGRPRFTKQGHAYTPTRTRSFESFVKDQADQQIDKPMRGPVMMDVWFKFNRPGRIRYASVNGVHSVPAADGTT